MNTASFDDIYRRELRPVLATFDERRQRIVRRMGLAALALACVGLIAAVSFLAAVPLHDGPALLVIVAAAPVVGAMLGATIAVSVMRGDYVRAFKHEVIGTLVRHLGAELRYTPESGISEETFAASQLFARSSDRYHSEDGVHGRVGDTEIVFSEVHAQYKVQTNKGTSLVTLFKGLFFMADFHKHFAGQTLVLPDTAQRIFGQFGQTLQDLVSRGGGSLVKLEDPVFESRFVVYATDQIEARYILSPSMMERLCALDTRNQDRISVGFQSSRMIVALPCARNRFEPRLFRSVADPSVAQVYWDDLRLAIGLVNDLNLNTRIWSKA